MSKLLQEKYDLLSEPGPSSTQDDSSSDYSTDSEEESSKDPFKKSLTEDYENELGSDVPNIFKKRRVKGKDKRIRKNVSKIPIHLKGLMGEANLRFARGEYETAEKMCYELIRQEPHASEPYMTLFQLYEGSDPEKSMQYLTIAAHLSPNNVDQWVRLAQLNIDKSNVKMAVTCFTRAIKAEKKNYDLHMKRIQLLEMLNDQKSVVKCKSQLLRAYSRKHPELIMSLAKELGEIYHKEKEYSKAIEVFNVPFTKCRKCITPEMVNMYLELLLLNENFPQCLDIFVQYCNVEIEIMLDDDNKVHVLTYTAPPNIQIDLQIKFIICLIKLKSFNLIDKMLEPLLADETNVEKIGDLYLDVAEALMSMDRHFDALKLLIPLIKSKNFSLAAVWLKHAECLEKCRLYSEAIESYYNVVRLAPLHIEVRYPLSELLVKAKHEKEALDVLNQDEDATEIDVGLLIKRMDLLKRLNMIKEYFKSVDLLLKRHCIELLHEAELRSVTFQESVKEKIQRINSLREFRGENEVQQNIISIREPSIEDEYKVYLDVLAFCYKNEYYIELKKFTFLGLSSSRFKWYLNEIVVIALFTCILTKDSYHAYAIIREIILRKNNNYNHRLWNIFNLTMQTQEEFRQSRFLMRQSKNKDFEFLKVLEANNALSSGSYKIATIYLMPFLKLKPTPFIYLMLGVVFLQVSCQKHREIKKKLTQCSYGLFLNYANRRGKAAYHEVCYNLGRLYHQYGILHIASHYYKLVLEITLPLVERYPHILDLKRAAAFNLCLIYQDSNNYIGAKNLMIKYITICIVFYFLIIMFEPKLPG